MRFLRIFFIGLILSSASAQAENNFSAISSVEYLVTSQSTAIPNENSNWDVTSLPFSKSGTSLNGGPLKGNIWFRKDLKDYPLKQQPEALYIQNHVFDIEVYLNHQRIGGRYREDGLQAMGWNHPLYLDILPSLWTEGSNTLHIRLGLGEPNAILSPIILGDSVVLKELYESRTFQQVTVALWSLIACVLMGVFTLSLWWFRRQDSLYLCFAIICFSWSLVMTYLVLPYSPIQHRTWLGLGYWAVDIAGFATFLFINRLMLFKHKHLERLLFLILLVSGLVLLTMNMRYHSLISSITHGLQFLFCCFVLVKTACIALTARRQEAIWVSVGLALMLMIMFRDLYVFWQAYQQPHRLPESTLMQYGFGILLVIVFIYLIRVFVQALNDSESLNKSLELRVKQATKSLQASYAENRLLEINESAQKERQKIYRDLHDDVGAKLVSIVHSGIENEQTDLARDALVSLREVVAQSSFQYQDISVLVVSSINEAEQRLSSAGITLEVQGAYDIKEEPIPSGVGYHISRILREVVTNIIKHSQAASVIMQCVLEHNVLKIQIQDNGKGMAGEGLSGNGLSNIRFRAEEIQAQVVWQSEAGVGCTFCLSYPLVFAH